MISQGVWLLMIMTFHGDGHIELIPYMQFPNWQLCNAWRERESIELLGGGRTNGMHD